MELSVSYDTKICKCLYTSNIFYTFFIITLYIFVVLISPFLLLLSNTDCLQQVEDYVIDCTLQLKKVKTIYIFHELVFIEETAVFNVSTMVAGSSRILYEWKNILLFVKYSLAMKDNGRQMQGVHVQWLFKLCLKSSVLVIITFSVHIG